MYIKYFISIRYYLLLFEQLTFSFVHLPFEVCMDTKESITECISFKKFASFYSNRREKSHQ